LRFDALSRSLILPYRGLVGVGGFISQAPPAEVVEDKSLTFTFGPNGFFGYGASDASTTFWWSTCEAESPPGELRLDVSKMRKQLKDRHGWWKDPVIQDILSKADVQSIYPTWTTPPLPRWGEDGIVLVGDAAHALQPTSGQGISQGLEDAKTLALCLEKYLADGSALAVGGGAGKEEEELLTAMNKATDVFYKVRSPRTNKIAERTKMMASSKKAQSFFAEMGVCFFLWLLGKFPSMGE
jgi:2-polyprenyl-6-methoxyphenol hydroxylase-like FAD-dependent oxidoreductase